MYKDNGSRAGGSHTEGHTQRRRGLYREAAKGDSEGRSRTLGRVRTLGTAFGGERRGNCRLRTMRSCANITPWAWLALLCVRLCDRQPT